jgi:excisionase family DNA binding protein
MASTPSKTRDGSGSRPRRPFLNVKEAAQELRLDESTLYRHLREGRFPGVKVGGRYLVPAAVIEELADGAMAAGHCVDIDEWAARWRDERAAAALGSAGPLRRSDAHPHGHFEEAGR